MAHEIDITDGQAALVSAREDAWHRLGTVLHTTTVPTDEQMDRMVTAWEHVTALYPDPDDQEERDAALSAAMQIILGDTTLEDEGRIATRAESAALRARAARAGAIIASEGTDSEVRLAERAQTTRVTVRRYLGKDQA